MFGYVSDEQFAKLRARWEQTDLSSLDFRIVPTLIKLGACPDIAPVWSCSGHSRVEQEKKKPKKKTIALSQSRYITFAVRQGHTQIFTHFDSYIKTLAYSDYIKARPRLTCLSLNYGAIDRKCDLTTYCVWRVEFLYRLHTDIYKNEHGIDPNWLEHLWENLINTLLEG